MKTVVLALIRIYKAAVSPSLSPACRFYPTCSQYAYDAVQRYGLFRGGAMGLKRLARCHPWHPGGYDPVPVDLSLRRKV